MENLGIIIFDIQADGWMSKVCAILFAIVSSLSKFILYPPARFLKFLFLVGGGNIRNLFAIFQITPFFLGRKIKLWDNAKAIVSARATSIQHVFGGLRHGKALLITRSIFTSQSLQHFSSAFSMYYLIICNVRGTINRMETAIKGAGSLITSAEEKHATLHEH